ncbi:lipopolysaccharide biosynthesis protein [Pseudoalteromonas sp. SS15]|uniref:lipopolysaccharide biosynthesis protein n=1 Tax=Pseudoalteromonas sp. SS15 TaxID=3139393 RepID=UPI003BAA8A19
MNKSKLLGYALGPLGSAALGFISLPLLTWFYSVEDVGKISMLLLVMNFGILTFCLGLDQAYVREYHEVNSKPALLRLVCTPSLLLMSLFALFVLLFEPSIISVLLYGTENTYLALLTLFCIVFAVISRYLSLILRMQERAIAYSLSQLLPKLIFLLCIIGIVVSELPKTDVSLISAQFASVFTVLLVLLWSTRNDVHKSFIAKATHLNLTDLLKFALPLMAGGFAAFGLQVMDKVFIRSFSTFTELGVYSVTVSIAAVASIFASIFNLIWSPMVYKWTSNGDLDLNIVDGVSEHLLAAIFFVMAIAGSFSFLLPYFLPEEYSAIQSLITVCLLAPLLYTLSETTAVGITLTRKTSLSMWASVLALVINAFGNYVLVEKFGAQGAAISTAVAFAAFYTLRTEFSRKVWRNMPTMKTYIVIVILLITSILHCTYWQQGFMGNIIWALLLVLGLLTFKRSVILGLSAFKKLVFKC